jgi:hypothetical protein
VYPVGTLRCSSFHRRAAGALVALAGSFAPGCALHDAAGDPPPPPTFTRRVDHDAPGSHAVAIADATGDGVPDVIYADDSLTLWAQTTTERRAILTDLPFELDAMVVADLDGNGFVDLVGCHERQLLAIHDLGGGPTMQTIDVVTDGFYLGGEDFAVGDFDADGRHDLVMATTDAGPLVFLQDAGGFGFSTPPTSLPIGDGFIDQAQRVEVADGDDDGRDDVLVLQPNELTPRVALFRQTGPGVFAPARTLLTEGAGDFSDEYEELIVTPYDFATGRTLLALRGSRADVLSLSAGASPQLIGPISGSFGDRAAAGDIRGQDFSGLVEIASVGRFSDQLVVLHQDVAGVFGGSESFGLPGKAVDVAVGDLDRDGRDDVAVLGTAKLSVFLTGP